MTLNANQGINKVRISTTRDIGFLPVNGQSVTVDDARGRFSVVRFGKAETAPLFSGQQGFQVARRQRLSNAAQNPSPRPKYRIERGWICGSQGLARHAQGQLSCRVGGLGHGKQARRLGCFAHLHRRRGPITVSQGQHMILGKGSAALAQFNQLGAKLFGHGISLKNRPCIAGPRHSARWSTRRPVTPRRPWRQRHKIAAIRAAHFAARGLRPPQQSVRRYWR